LGFKERRVNVGENWGFLLFRERKGFLKNFVRGSLPEKGILDLWEKFFKEGPFP